MVSGLSGVCGGATPKKPTLSAEHPYADAMI